MQDSTTSLTLDSRVTTYISQTTWSSAIAAAAITGPQGRVYTIDVMAEAPLVRLSQCHSLIVAGRVQVKSLCFLRDPLDDNAHNVIFLL